MPPPIGPPTLCRLCRRPIPRAAKTCPSCGARQSWSGRTRTIDARSRRRAWRIGLGAVLLVLLAVGAIVWLGVLREIKAGVSSKDAPAGRPSAKECAELARELTNRPAGDQRVSSELRDRIRQCFERR
jgi:RNA polymerase subunit RPABC4/transcription elongation factor Spt4